MTLKNKHLSQTNGWARSEFEEVDLGDQRLRTRLIKLADRFAASPESPMNQACNDWAETKAAYRFFQNENVHEEDILRSHIAKRFSEQKNRKEYWPFRTPVL